MPATGWPNIFSATPALGLVFSQQDHSWFWQAEQAPQPMGKGTTTRSPTRSLSRSTPGPTSTHLAHELVAHDVALLHRRHVAVEQVQVGSADRGRGDLHDRVAAVEDARVRDL